MARAYAGCPSTLITRGRTPLVPDNAKRKEELGRHQVSLGRQQKIDCVAGRINGSVQVSPLTPDPDIRFIDPPGSVWMPHLTTKPLIQNGRIVLDPAPYGDVVHQQAAFHHHLFQVAVAERVAQIPPNAQDDDHVLEVPPSEQRRAVLAHASPYQTWPTGVLQQIPESPF